jgi:DNA polymerase-1
VSKTTQTQNVTPAKNSHPKYFFIDALYAAYRSYCTPMRPLYSPSGLPTTAIHVFFGSIRSAIKEMEAERVVLAWEGGPGHREALSKDYKSNRPPFPAPLQQQLPWIKSISAALGWVNLECVGYEADDVLGTLLKKSDWEGATSVVFTTDKDVLACITKHSSVFKKEKGKGWLIEPQDIVQKWGVQPHQIPEVLILCGDPVDNIPGIKGIGKQQATKLIQQYGTVDNLLAAKDSLPEKLKNLLISQADALEKSRALIKLNTDLPVELPSNKPQMDQVKVTQLLTELGMHKTLQQWIGTLQQPIPYSPANGML